METEFGNSKAKYKEYVKGLSDAERFEERKDIRIELMKAKIDSDRGLNPYQKASKDVKKSQYNPKMLRWKLHQLTF